MAKIGWTLGRLPVLGQMLKAFRRTVLGAPRRQFPGSSTYWDNRYKQGGTSGLGSYGKLAEFKASVLNDFVLQSNIQSVIEFGCGDGNQLLLASYPKYLGLDVSESAIEMCRQVFANDESKSFKHVSEYRGEQADLSLSLDVIFHLVEDPVFDKYMGQLFDASTRNVVVYSSNFSSDPSSTPSHMRHRKFTDWVSQYRTEWKLQDEVPNAYPYFGNDAEGSFSSFFFFRRD